MYVIWKLLITVARNVLPLKIFYKELCKDFCSFLIGWVDVLKFISEELFCSVTLLAYLETFLFKNVRIQDSFAKTHHKCE